MLLTGTAFPHFSQFLARFGLAGGWPPDLRTTSATKAAHIAEAPGLKLVPTRDSASLAIPEFSKELKRIVCSKVILGRLVQGLPGVVQLFGG